MAVAPRTVAPVRHCDRAVPESFVAVPGSDRDCQYNGGQEPSDRQSESKDSEPHSEPVSSSAIVVAMTAVYWADPRIQLQYRNASPSFSILDSLDAGRDRFHQRVGIARLYLLEVETVA